MHEVSHVKLAALVTLAAIGATLALIMPEATAAVGSMAWTPLGEFAGLDIVVADGAALAALRTRLSDLETRAADKLAEITDETSAEEARRIEAEHRTILEDLDGVRAEIAAAESAGASDDPGDDEETAPAQRAHRDAQRTETRQHGGGGNDRNHGGHQLPDVDAAVQRALGDERARQAEVRELQRRHGLPDAFADRHIDQGSDIAAVRSAALDELARRSHETRIFPHVETTGMQDERDIMRRGMTGAIEARLARASGERNIEVPEPAQRYAGMELAEMAAECIAWRGNLRTGRQITEMFQRAFHTVSDFPAIFTDALNNRLLARYEAAAPTYRRLATRLTAADFREMNVIRAGDFPALQPINEAGEIRGGTFGESKEVFRVHPYGVRFQITRQMLVNDQLGAIDQVLGSSGQRVADWENGKFYEVLLDGNGAGPMLKTGNRRLFHTQHGNLAAEGSPIDVDAVAAGRAAMAMQTTLDGIKANFQPRILLTSPVRITQAEQLLTQLTPAQQNHVVPASIRSLEPISDANLEGNGWYLFADPMVAPVIAYGFLEGFEGPRLTSEDVFDVQGIKIKLEHDFGVTGIDFRGAWRDPGAEPASE